MKLLEEKVALITGASRGIGKAIALEFAKHGCNIAFSDIKRDENMEACEKELRESGVKAEGFVSNAASFEDSAALVENVAKQFGKIDILVNNAGITRDNLLMRMSESDWDLVMNVNLKSVFNLTHACQKVMLKQRCGSIINMSSVVGVSGNAGQANYSASKAGIIGFTKSVAKELGSRNIRCNAIAPGFIATDMTDAMTEEAKEKIAESIPFKRIGQPEEIAEMALFLASDKSDYITGQVFAVDGGMTI